MAPLVEGGIGRHHAAESRAEPQVRKPKISSWEVRNTRSSSPLFTSHNFQPFLLPSCHHAITPFPPFSLPDQVASRRRFRSRSRKRSCWWTTTTLPKNTTFRSSQSAELSRANLSRPNTKVMNHQQEGGRRRGLLKSA